MRLTRTLSAALGACALLAVAGPATAASLAPSPALAFESASPLATPVQYSHAERERAEIRREMRERAIRREVRREHRERQIRREIRRERAIRHGVYDRRW